LRKKKVSYGLRITGRKLERLVVEEQRLTYFIRLPASDNSDKLAAPHLNRPVGRPSKNGIQVKVVDLQHKAKIGISPAG